MPTGPEVVRVPGSSVTQAYSLITNINGDNSRQGNFQIADQPDGPETKSSRRK
jgi:hypothetical protein